MYNSQSVEQQLIEKWLRPAAKDLVKVATTGKAWPVGRRTGGEETGVTSLTTGRLTRRAGAWSAV